MSKRPPGCPATNRPQESAPRHDKGGTDRHRVALITSGTHPLASNINYLAGQTVPNSVITPASASGEVCFYSMADTDLLVDVNDWFASR